MVERAETLRETSAWRRLEWHRADVRHSRLRGLFDGDPGRGERLAAEAAGLYLDYSKHLLTDETLELLRKLAAERGLPSRIAAMFRGDRVNVSEDRPALHIALRMPRSRSLVVDGVDVVRQVHEEQDRINALAEAVRSGSWVGATGRPIRTVVNLGIGGSHLGPALACEALRPYATAGVRYRFVSSVDPAALAEAIRDLDPAETLVVVVSKTMTTLETLTNARAAEGWLRDALGGEVQLQRHFLGVTAHPDAAAALGIPPDNVFRIWDWVGGRTSLCSAAGLTTCIALGPDGFRELLDGFRAMDEHFATTPLGGNLPAIAGLIAVWYRNFLGAQSTAVVPHSHALRLLPPYLQQLAMESNGKRVTASGEPVEVDTAPVTWGGEGTDAQHAFFQLLHQGTVLCPVDLVALARPATGDSEGHDLLAANVFAQAAALAFGRTAEELDALGVDEREIPHRVLPGDRPTSVILARLLRPATLGALIAFYEHSVFTQAAIWEIDAFDQWGVELGKELALRLTPELAVGWKRELLHDSSTNALVRRYRQLRDAGD